MENKETQHSQKREKIEMKIAQIESWMRDLEKEIAFYKQRIPEISARMSEIALKANNDAAYKEYEDLDERRFLMNHFWLPRRDRIVNWMGWSTIWLQYVSLNCKMAS